MKKISILCSVLLLAACSGTKEAQNQVAPDIKPAIPCSYSCQTGMTEPCPVVENIKKPRVTEIMPKSRPCCADENPNAKDIIPDAPEIYVIAANRTLRSLLNNNLPLQQNAKIFVADTVNNETDLPTGTEKGTESLKRGLERAEKFVIVEDREQADYVFLSVVSWYDTATKEVPAIKYSLGLFDNHGQKIGEWNEILHQANGDRSWW